MDTALWAATIIIVTVIGAATLAGWWSYRLDMLRLKLIMQREAMGITPPFPTSSDGEGDLS